MNPNQTAKVSDRLYKLKLIAGDYLLNVTRPFKVQIGVKGNSVNGGYMLFTGHGDTREEATNKALDLFYQELGKTEGA